MLLLTFFSNTIMNYSLPEVSSKRIEGGTLSEQIRGSGTVEANQSYEVKIDETRKIAGVEVKVGDEVEKGQTLFTLEDSESTELDEARKTLITEQQALDDLQLAYDKALLKTGNDYSKENLAIANQEEDIAIAKEDLSKLSEYQEAYEKAKMTARDCESAVNDLKEQLTVIESTEETADYSALGTSYYNRITSAKTALENAEKSKTKTEDKIKEYETSLSAGEGSNDSISAAKKAMDEKQLEIAQTEEQITYAESETAANTLRQTLEKLNLEYEHLIEDYNKAVSESTDYNRTKQLITGEKNTLEIKKTEYDRAKKKYDDTVSEIKNELKEKLRTAEDDLEAAQDSEAELEKKASKTVEEAEKDIRDKERALETAKLELAEKQRTDAQAAGESALDLKAQQDKISDQKEKVTKQEETIKKLEEKSVGAKITAQVAGKITELSVVAGEEAAQGTTIAKIEMSEKGYTLEMKVTVEQSKKVKIGDEADIQYFWGGDVSATLQSINTDTENPSKNRILKFAVKGDVNPGQSLQLAMGSKGQQYDLIVPKSAIREDNNGKFVLTVVAKSSPLGNRYVAERVDVEILASDETSSAVSGAIYNGEYVITTSTKPIEPGDQVRLVDE